MTLKDLITLMQTESMDKCISVLETHALVKSISDSLKQYDPYGHNVMDPLQRQDKKIYDDSDTEEAKVIDVIPLARIPLALQKKIVLTTAAFLGTPKIEATTNTDVEENMVAGIKKTWDDNKLDYKFKTIAKKTMSELQTAELWFTKAADVDYWTGTNISGKFKLNMLLLSYCNGDSLYPVFDEFGDMIAFGRAYKIKTIEGKDEDFFDVYTADVIYYSKKVGTEWQFATTVIGENNVVDFVYSAGFKGVPNPIKKIPVIYYYQPFTEWNDVQPLIDRLEEILSNHADTNDYVGSPIVFAEGDDISFPRKGETGKLLQGKNGAKVSYLTYDAQPGSVKMEIDNLKEYIFKLTHTPDISFENMKGLGYFSTIALETLFLDAHIKAADKEEIFGEGLQRRLNYLKNALAYIDVKLKAALPLSIKPKFEYFVPQNTKEFVELLIEANKAGMISDETMVRSSPLVADADSELEKLDEESAAAPPVPIAPANPVNPLAVAQ